MFRFFTNSLSVGLLLVCVINTYAETVEFNRDIRLILSNNCLQCHGPDAAKRKAGLRLDTEAGARGDLGEGRFAVVGGKPEKSELFLRITSTDDKHRMPPASTGKKLTERQVKLLEEWIRQGAQWQKHWALLPPNMPAIPTVKQRDRVRNPLDAFVLARLEQEGLSPSAEADKITLIRRVTLDLTGIPPTVEEVDAYLRDDSPDAYEKVVDHLLASPRYGERMAIRWLNAARYADTNGYQNDGERFMWRWRDWVIDAFNSNMTFDRFTIEQLAGDLLPNPTLEQRIATGFNRNHRGNAEGGVIPEEYAVEYVADRVETTSTVWLGLTMQCSRCHDHKYDPFGQKEFYQLFAFFNNIPERGKAIKYGNSPPYIKAPTPTQMEQQRELEKRVTAAQQRVDSLRAELLTAQRTWEKSLPNAPRLHWVPTSELTAHFSFDGGSENTLTPEKPGRFEEGEARYAEGRMGKAGEFDGKSFVNAGDIGDFGFYDKFTLTCWVRPSDNRGGTIVSRMSDVERGDGYSVRLIDGKIQVNLVKRWLDDALRVETEDVHIARDSGNRWYHVAVSYDATRLASGVQVYIDGKPTKLKVLLDDLNQSFKTTQPFRIGAGNGAENRFHGRIDEVRVYSRVLTETEIGGTAVTQSLQELLADPSEKRTPVQSELLQSCFLEKAASDALRTAFQELNTVRRRLDDMMESFPTTMVMQEMPTPRAAHLLIRGQYDKPGERVSPDVPGSLPPLSKNGKRDRLQLARWLMGPSHPLTARVAVNRLWQMFFGVGLVKTVDDFGVQGDWPSHPELLDWLALEFSATGWDMKALQRTIVTSATYRQSSKVTKEIRQRDPENRLLAHGPRFRLSAEMIRDQALAASGLLVERIGGPSVKPYQPDGLWKELTGENYVQDKGEKLYRRGIYTFWKRTIAPPSMVNFDAPMRETCYVRETRTNTPLQALNLLNDVTYVEAARVLAERVLSTTNNGDDRLILIFRRVVARSPKPMELQILKSAFQEHLQVYRQDGKAAERLLQAGEYPRCPQLDPAETAAYTAIAAMVLNLDEAVTKE